MGITRKKFINFLLSIGTVGGLTAIIYPVLSFLDPPKVPVSNVKSVKVGKQGDFPNNTSSIVKFGRTPVILFRTEDGNFKAFNATCTHLDCIVQYSSEKKQIWCACHNGIYDINGNNVSGPPPRPLEPYLVNIVNDEIIITQEG